MQQLATSPALPAITFAGRSFEKLRAFAESREKPSLFAREHRSISIGGSVQSLIQNLLGMYGESCINIAVGHHYHSALCSFDSESGHRRFTLEETLPLPACPSVAALPRSQNHFSGHPYLSLVLVFMVLHIILLLVSLAVFAIIMIIVIAIIIIPLPGEA